MPMGLRLSCRALLFIVLVRPTSVQASHQLNPALIFVTHAPPLSPPRSPPLLILLTTGDVIATIIPFTVKAHNRQCMRYYERAVENKRLRTNRKNENTKADFKTQNTVQQCLRLYPHSPRRQQVSEQTRK